MADEEESVEETYFEEEETSVKNDSLENSILSGDNEDNISNGGDPGEQHEFEIIDQVESEEETEDGSELKGRLDANGKSIQERIRGEDDDSSDTDDFDDTELHALLEKGIDKDSITTKQNSEEPTDGGPIIRHKIVLKELDSDPFDILPEGWVCATHNCGMPVYLHKESRVCTMARPYYLGAASTRKHDIPISAIPCLQYRNQLKKFQKDDTAQDEKALEEVHIENGNADSDELTERKVSNHDHQNENSSQEQLPSVECTHKHKAQMWMVAQESSFRKGGVPTNTSTEALHTGKEDYKDESTNVHDSEGRISVHTSCSHSDIALPASPGVENIAVTFETSTQLNTDDDAVNALNGVSSENGNALGFHSVAAVSIEEETDVKITHCTSESTGSVMSSHDLDSNIDTAECEVSQISQPVSHNCSLDNSSSKNDSLVFEEASNNLEPSEIVTSNTNVSPIKRKLENWKNSRGGKFLKHSSGSALPVDSVVQPDINIAVKSTNPESEDAARAHFNATADEQLKAHMAEVKIKTAEERAKESLLDINTVHTYCAHLFQFKTIEVKKYRTWRERRKHLGERNRSNRPELPSSTKLITCPIIGNNKANGSLGVGKKKEFVLNPSGKSFLCILHEYMQRTLKIQPTYVFKELENSKTPYGATVMINNIEYGTGYASSKKMAKQEAAKETLKILIPDLSSKITEQEMKHSISDLSFFDEIKVEDPRVYELGNKVGQPSPFQLLRECLRRNFGMGNTQCDVSTTALKNQKCEFTIKVGKHTATVVAKNKRDGKQLAAQAILAKLHPHVPSWGSLLRLYATNVEKPMEKIEEMNEIKTHVPNKAVLESLREEMRKLHKQKEAIQSKGKIVISSRDLPVKMSGVDL